MQTQKAIKEKIKELEKSISDLRDYRKHIPKYCELEKKLADLKNRYWIKTYPKLDKISDEISSLKEELREMKKSRELKISPRLEQWLKDYNRGVDFGYGGIKIAWFSKDERFVIITNKGGTAGQGTAMGAGGYHYSPTDHWVIDTKEGNSYHNTKQHFRIEGRLTKEKKQEMIDRIKELL